MQGLVICRQTGRQQTVGVVSVRACAVKSYKHPWDERGVEAPGEVWEVTHS